MKLAEDLKQITEEADRTLSGVLAKPEHERTPEDFRAVNLLLIAINDAYDTINYALEEAGRKGKE